jgi:hypothetical protein
VSAPSGPVQVSLIDFHRVVCCLRMTVAKLRG